jgi:hypothetical protein
MLRTIVFNVLRRTRLAVRVGLTGGMGSSPEAATKLLAELGGHAWAAGLARTIGGHAGQLKKMHADVQSFLGASDTPSPGEIRRVQREASAAQEAFGLDAARARRLLAAENPRKPKAVAKPSPKRRAKGSKKGRRGGGRRQQRAAAIVEGEGPEDAEEGGADDGEDEGQDVAAVAGEEGEWPDAVDET